jgi:hypothetical protein
MAFGSGAGAPENKKVGTNPTDLAQKMRKLLEIFAHGDGRGMARRLFDRFLAKQTAVTYYEDPNLNNAAAGHAHITSFMTSALSPPNSLYQSAGKMRIHQALKSAGWDIGKISVPTDLGVPAFNIGSKAFSTQDFANGLGLMINGVQHVYVVAKNYGYDPKAMQYRIVLKYIFYDVFGLDDEDLRRFGAASDSLVHSKAAIAITAWWQLQHQHSYAPLVTRIILKKTFEVPAV